MSYNKTFRKVLYHVVRDCQSIIRSSGESYTALGRAVGISDAAVCAFMHDEHGAGLSFETLQRICASFGVDIDLKRRNKGRTIRFTVNASAEVGKRVNDQLKIDGRPPLNIPTKPLFNRVKAKPVERVATSDRLATNVG